MVMFTSFVCYKQNDGSLLLAADREREEEKERKGERERQIRRDA